MAAVLKSQMSDREIPIRSILDSYRYFFELEYTIITSIKLARIILQSLDFYAKTWYNYTTPYDWVWW